MLGMEATLFSSEPGDPSGGDITQREDSMQWKFLRSRANTIEGGTAEVLRNIVAERLLGLPGDVRVDKDKPWRDVPRG
jgi:hypothetical protein